jgi:hypothetical protein
VAGKGLGAIFVAGAAPIIVAAAATATSLQTIAISLCCARCWQSRMTVSMAPGRPNFDRRRSKLNNLTSELRK